MKPIWLIVNYEAYKVIVSSEAYVLFWVLQPVWLFKLWSPCGYFFLFMKPIWLFWVEQPVWLIYVVKPVWLPEVLKPLWLVWIFTQVCFLWYLSRVAITSVKAVEKAIVKRVLRTIVWNWNIFFFVDNVFVILCRDMEEHSSKVNTSEDNSSARSRRNTMARTSYWTFFEIRKSNIYSLMSFFVYLVWIC